MWASDVAVTLCLSLPRAGIHTKTQQICIKQLRKLGEKGFVLAG